MTSPRPYTYTFVQMRKGTKFVIGGLAVVIVFTFVFAGLFNRLNADAQMQANSIATIAGSDVTRDQFRTATARANLHVQLTIGEVPNTEEYYEDLQRLAWSRLAAMRWAEKLGISTSDDEIDAAIRKEFVDQAGNYSPQAYQQFAQTLTQRMGLRPDDITHYFRESLTLAKMTEVIGMSTWVSPTEVDQEISRFTDTYIIDYAIVPSDSIGKRIKVTHEEIQDYYESNADDFMEPERINVRYVSFPASEHLASQVVPEDELQRYYEDNSEIYSYTNATNEFVTEYTPFEDVREEIEAKLSLAYARDDAEREAMDLVMSMTSSADGEPESLDTAVKARNLTIEISDWFSRTEMVEGLEVGPDFVDTAYELAPDSMDEYFSTPILGEDTVYVIACNETKAPHVPELEAIKDTISELALAKKRADRLDDKAEETLAAIKTGIAAGKTFVEAAEKQDLEPSQTEELTRYTGASTNVYFADSLMDNAFLRQQGEFIDSIRLTNGIVIARLAERRRGEGSMDPNFRMYIAGQIRQTRSSMIYQEWRSWITSKDSIDQIFEDETDEDVETEDS